MIPSQTKVRGFEGKVTGTFASLISLFIAIHVTSGKHECSVRRFKEVYEDNSRWMSPIAIDFNGNEKALLFPLAYMIPFTNATSSEINKEINLELFAHYTYLSMAMHFERDDINLPGFHKFFNDSAEKEMRDAHKFMKYQNLRGGRVKLHTIYRPCEDEWGNGLNAMKIALELEKELYESLLVLHSLASQYNDPQLQKFLVHNFLDEQVESIKQLANYVNTLNRFEESGNYQLGEYQFDKITLKGGEK